MPKTKPVNLTRQVMEITDITASALARKLRVKVADVRSWAEGMSRPSASARAALQILLERTAVQKPLSGPRVKRERLESAVVCADSRSYLAETPDESVDLILSDIPYGIGLDEWDVLHRNTNSAYLGSSAAQERAGRVFHKRRKPINGWSSADKGIPHEYYDWCSVWAPEWLRVLRPGGSAIVFAGRRLAHRCIAALEDAGFNYRDMFAWLRTRAVFRAQRLSVIYQKRGDLAEARRWEGWRVGNLKPTFEPIIWCFKPYSITIADNMLDHNVGAMNTDRFSDLNGAPENVLRFGFEPGEQCFHEAQKPVKLLRTLIELCTTPGQMVLDPFAGSGSTAVAAKICGRRYLVIDVDDDNCHVTEERLTDQHQLAIT